VVRPLLLTLGLGVFAGALDLSVLSPALPAIGRELGVATSDLAWIFTLYLLASIVSIAVAGALADRLGRRSVYLGCIALFAAGSVLAMAAPNFAVLLTARALQALGAGGVFPVATAAIGDVVPRERRGAALGLVAATWGLAAVIGPTFGGIVTHFASWRWVFAPNLPIALGVFALARIHVPSLAPRRREPFDGVGLFLLCAGLLALTDGLITSRASIGILGVTALAGFALWEQRVAEYPVVPTALFRTPQLAKTYALEITIGMLEGALFFIPTVLVGAQGLSTAAAGAIAALGALTFVTVIPAAGRALDRIGSRDVLLIGTILTELGLGIFALGFGSLWLALLSMVVAGAGFGALLGAPTRYIVTNETPENVRGTAVALLSQCLIVGQIVGSAVAGGLIGLATNELLGYRHAYLAFCAIAFVALILAASLKSRRDERTQPIAEAA
ncbi:MAG: MFS transporter, partial [Candidatus Eremiobacteraeota bacterium]|nr:MFS transporter [Candidatus Eremiobacteraeota bacterium]